MANELNTSHYAVLYLTQINKLIFFNEVIS